MSKQYSFPAKGLLALAMMFGMGLAMPTAAHAATINVGCNVTELVNAINTANVNAGADTLELASNCTYTLTTVNNTDATLGENGLPVITSDITIHGNDATITRSGTESFRFLQVNSGATLTLSNIALTNANVLGNGGAIHNSGTVHVIQSTLTHNTTSCAFDQHLFTTGGGIYNTSVLTVLESTFTDNVGAGSTCEPGGGYFGGAIVSDGNLSIDNSTFINNINHIDNSGTMSLTNSTIVGGSCSYKISGCALYNDGTADVTNVTISNVPGGMGGALYNDFGNTLTLRNSIVATDYGCEGFINDGGGNLHSPATNGCPGIATNPKLSAIQDNGGSTQTLALAPDSPAINAAVDANCPATDQRGIARAQGKHCDIGAFELQAPSTPDLLSPTDNKKVTKSEVKLKWTAAERVAEYQVIVRMDSAKGKKILSEKITTTQFKIRALESGHWYYWRIKACSKVGCTTSTVWRFRVK